MTATINRIVELSGPLPDEALHRHWLGTLRTDELERRLTALEEDAGKPATPNLRGKFRRLRQQILLRA